MSDRDTLSPLDVTVVTEGAMAASVGEHARHRIAAATEHLPAHIGSVRVRLTRHGTGCPAPVTAQVNLAVNGRLVRAQVWARTGREAVDLLDLRLRHVLERWAWRWSLASRHTAGPAHPWRHDPVTAIRPRSFQEPHRRQAAVHRKAVCLAKETIDGAAFHMDVADYDFHLFVEAGSRQDSVIYHAGPTGYRVAQAHPSVPGDLAHATLPVTMADRRAPVLTVDQAAHRLECSERPFVFFVHTDSGRGNVLYRRYDGDFGLLTPVIDKHPNG